MLYTVDMHRSKKFRRHPKALLLIVVIVIALVAIVIRARHASAPTKIFSATKKTALQSKPPEFDKTQHSIDQPGSLWWIVNKKRPLPSGYAPSDLTVPAVALRLGSGAEEMHVSGQQVAALQSLLTAAKAQGFNLMIASGYRSYGLQTLVYNNYVKQDGQAAADRYSARPGTSEHQTGLAVDICEVNTSCSLEQSFGSTPAGKWVAAHAYKYGYIIRYEQNKENITGYMYEPWHLRFVGKDLSAELHSRNQTMEEFFGL